MRNAPFHDFLNNIQKRIDKLRDEFVKKGEQPFIVQPEKYPTWISKENFEKTLNSKLKPTQYRMLVSKLNEIWLQPNVDLEMDFLRPLLRPAMLKEAVIVKKEPDEWGRIYSVGRRKASVAKVWLAKGTGEFLVNGKTLSEFFPTIPLREEVMRPLLITQRILNYNVWTLCQGGGFSG